MMTLCFLFSLAASWVADVVCGRYKTILVAGLIYIVGLLAAAWGTLPGAENIGLFFFGILGLVPIATAGIKANLSNLGADQFHVGEPGQEAAQERFFYIFYLFINIGSLVAFGCMTTFASNGGLGVPQIYGYFSAYMLAAVFMMVATGIYVWGSDRYRKVPTLESSAICSVANVLQDMSRSGSREAASVCAGVSLLFCSIMLSVAQAFSEASPLKHTLVLCGFVCGAGGLIAVVVPCSNTAWLAGHNDAEAASEEQAVFAAPRSRPSRKDVQGFLDLLPVLFMGNIAFSALYNCMAFWYQQQACQMDLRITPSIQLAGSFFNVADCIAIIVVTPLVVDWLNPTIAENMKVDFGYGLKFGVGMGFAATSVAVAIWLEGSRRSASVLDVLSQCAPDGVYMSAFPSAWMFLPYFLMGIGEVYCNPTLMHFAYVRSPVSMRTLTAAVSFFIQAVSTALFGLLLDVISGYVPNDLNDGHLEYGYGISILIAVVFYMLFSMVLI
jgi:dipeptide/tripeptide permease